MYIARACNVCSWRPHTTSTTLHDLLAQNAWPLLVPLLRARDAVRDAAETLLNVENSLFFEFVALLSWHPGSFIGDHYDANRPYLEQRHLSAVLYLNDQGRDFEGGDFHFRDGVPDRVHPRAGRLIVFGTGEADTHSVEPVTSGERITLTLWLTRDPAANLDTPLLSRWWERLSSTSVPPSPSFMHEEAYLRLGPEGEQGPAVKDLRDWRAAQLGIVPFDPRGEGAAARLHLAAFAKWRPAEAGGELEALWRAYLDQLWAQLCASVPRWTSVGSAYIC